MAAFVKRVGGIASLPAAKVLGRQHLPLACGILQTRFDSDFAQPQLRATRNRNELKRRGAAKEVGFSAKPAHHLEVSPKRKRRIGSRSPKHKHGTDLLDLDAAPPTAAGTDQAGGSPITKGSFTVPEDTPPIPESSHSEEVSPARYRHIRKLVQRPVAALPRNPSFYVKFGAPMTAEDLTHDAPSVFMESRRLIDDVLEKRQSLQSSPDHVAPDTPFWRLPRTVLSKGAVEWQGDKIPKGGDPDDQWAAPDPTVDESGSAPQDHLQGITDLRKAKVWRMEAVAPQRLASQVLAGREHEEAELSQPGHHQPPSSSSSSSSSSVDAAATPQPLGGQGDWDGTSHNNNLQAGDSGAPVAEVLAKAKKTKKAAKRGDAAEGLVATLRRKAEDFALTGIDPAIKDSLQEALKHHPGTEKSARLQEMKSFDKDFETLVREGRASVENFNQLIRAQALQGRFEDALKTHDAMLKHGYDPNDGTFVSLIMGASDMEDPALARKIFLMMREQLITATPKVYAALIKAHTKVGDLNAGFDLLHKMQDEGLQADVVIYTILIDGLVNQGMLTKAWEEFHSARTWKLIEPDEVLFTVMIKACAKNSEAERALNIWDDMKMCGLYPTDITYGELIHAMSTSPDLAHKAFDFYRHMQAEDLPISEFVYSKLLAAARVLGDPRRAQTVVADMHTAGIEFTPEMYYDLVGLMATATKQKRISEQEILRNLRSAWHIVAEARTRLNDELDWTRMLNEVMGVYIAGGFTNYAVNMLQQYDAFDAKPDTQTYIMLLNMLGKDLKDVGRFFSLWEALPRDPKPADELYHLALEMALESRSARRTVGMLQEMHSAEVFPSPDLAERLAKAGRNVIQIHEWVGKLVALNTQLRVRTAKRDTALLQTHIDERDAILATEGKTPRTPTPAQEVRDKYFAKLKKQGYFRRPWLPLGEYIQSKKKGGEAYAARHDKPRPNIMS